MADRHPATVGLLRWFEYDHLPEHLQAVSRPCCELAHEMVDELPDGPELSAGLRDLLKAKDAFVRAAIEAVQSREGTPCSRKLEIPNAFGGVLVSCELRAGHPEAHRNGDTVWLDPASRS